MARILAVILVVAISMYVFSIRDQAERYAIYGYPGIFILSFLAYATVILPAARARLYLHPKRCLLQQVFTRPPDASI